MFPSDFDRKEKPNVALYYLKNALQIEESDSNAEELNIAGTHLNLCAIYGKLNKHLFAIFHAWSAIKLIEKINRERQMLE